MISRLFPLLLLLILSVDVLHADIIQHSLQNKRNTSLPTKQIIGVSKGEDYKKIRKNLMASGWQPHENPYFDKSTSQFQDAIKINKLLGFFEFQQCFTRGKNLFSCDVGWTSTGNKENPELFFGILIDVESKTTVVENDVKSN